MKALISKYFVAVAAVFLSSLLFTTQANAHYCKHKSCYYRHYAKYYIPVKVSVPTATCYAHNTQLPLPPYVCCKVSYQKYGSKHISWMNRWVENSCRNSNLYATYSLGCKTDTPVLSTGVPIMGNCQFSASTNRYR